MITEQVVKQRDAMLEEIYRMMNLGERNLGRLLARLFFSIPAQRFAELALNFDEQVRKHGLAGGVRWLTPHFIQSVCAKGAENIPSHGPLVIASNHPGAYDGLAIVSSLPREDLKLVISGIPFTQGLKHTSAQLFYVPRENLPGRSQVIRDMIRSLRKGESVLIFPHGNVEPDPAFSSLAKSALAKWSGSLEIVLRSVPEARVLVTIASNVVEKKNMGHFLSRLQKDPYSRQKMAEVVQISQQLIFKVKSKLVPRVVFAEACTASELQVTTGKSGILPAIIEQASRLMDDPFLVSEQSV